MNVDDAFWNITMSATSQDSGLDTPRRHKSSNQQKDPLNTFKAFRYIFDEVENKPWLSKGKQERTKGKKKEEDMLDIYADWAPTTLDMKKMAKYDKEEEMEEEEDMLDIYADWAPATLDMKKMAKYDKEEVMEEEEDMLDIYAEWAPVTLDDQRIEKKRSKRGRGPAPGRRTVSISFSALWSR